MLLAKLIQRCAEPTIDDSPRFYLREAVAEDRQGVEHMMRYEHELRVTAAIAACAMNGRKLPGDDVLRCWVLVEMPSDIVGILVGTEAGHSVRVAELYVRRDRRRRGLGGRLLWAAQFWASRKLNPVVVTLSSGDQEGRRWLERRDFEPGRHCDGTPVQLGPGVDGLDQLCYVHPNGCGFPSVRIAR